jgi:hypothetical protein
MTIPQYPFITSAEMCKLMQVSRSYLRDRRLTDWQYGIHWIYLKPEMPQSGTRYNQKLCQHWMTCPDPDVHKAAIQAYLKHFDPFTPPAA